MAKKFILLIISIVFTLALFNSTKGSLKTNNTTIPDVIDYINDREDKWESHFNRSEIVSIINQTVNIPDMSKYYTKSQVDSILRKKQDKIDVLNSEITSLKSNVSNLNSLIEEQNKLIQKQNDLIKTQRSIISALESVLLGEANKTSKIAKALEEGQRIYYNETTGELKIASAKPWYYKIGAWFKGFLDLF